MKVKYIPTIPHCFAFGGFEIQLLSTFDALNKLGVNVSKIDPWLRDTDFDVLHCWGLNLSNYETIEWAKKSGKKVVLTALFNFYDTPEAKIRHFITTHITRVGKYFQRIVAQSDEIVVVSDLQAEVLSTYFNVHSSKISVIPNIVSPSYFDFQNEVLPLVNNFDNYILCTGNICKRKNQYNLAKAAIETDKKLMLIGKVLEGEEKYGEELEILIKENKGQNIHWIKGVGENSDTLIKAYKSCKMFALPSFMEMQPISALEAAVMGKPILLGKKSYSKQKYYQNAILVNPESISEIAEGIIKIFQSPTQYIVPKLNLEDCKEENVSNAYLKVYNRLLV